MTGCSGAGPPHSLTHSLTHVWCAAGLFGAAILAPKPEEPAPIVKEVKKTAPAPAPVRTEGSLTDAVGGHSSRPSMPCSRPSLCWGITAEARRQGPRARPGTGQGWWGQEARQTDLRA